VWRWDLAPPNATPSLYDDAGVLSGPPMSRVMTSLPMLGARVGRSGPTAGKVTGTWLSGKTPPPGNWKLYVDRVIAV
jgi:hypothetical protein